MSHVDNPSCKLTFCGISYWSGFLIYKYFLQLEGFWGKTHWYVCTCSTILLAQAMQYYITSSGQIQINTTILTLFLGEGSGGFVGFSHQLVPEIPSLQVSRILYMRRELRRSVYIIQLETGQ